MKIAHFISRHSWIILLLAVILVPLSIIGSMGTAVDYDVLNYLPKQLDSMRGGLILNEEFGDASSAMLIVEGKSTRELLDLKAKIAAVPGVAGVIGVDDIIDPNIPREVLPAAIRESFYSGEGTLLIVQFKDRATSQKTVDATVRLRALLDKHAFLSGTTASNIDNKDLSERETPLYLGCAVVLLILILGLGMESWLIPLVFLAEIGLAILYNLGSNIVFGKISYLTQALAAVLQLGVTMDFSIFLLHRYDEERKSFVDKREAMAWAIKKTFLTISGGALTEIAGFLALCVMELAIGADIGIVMAKGVLIGLVVTMTVLPSMILVFDGPIHRLRHRPVMPRFKNTAAFVTKHAFALSIVFVLLFIPAVYGRSHAQQDYDLSGSLPPDLPSVIASNKLKTDYNMTTTHFLIVRDNLSPAAIRDLIGGLDGIHGVSGVLAIEKYLGALIPEEFLPDAFRTIFKHGGKELIIVNSSLKSSTPEAMKQLDSMIALVKSFDPEGLVTGEAALAKDLVSVAANDFKRVDIVSVCAILFIILVIFSSVSLPIILVGSIELAILINLGLPFFINEKVSFLSTIVIGCIQLGVTIDYAILLVTRFKEELRTGLATREAMRVAFEASAPSIITSGLALFSATEVVALVSQQSILKSICAMIARGSLISVAVILVFLPALLILFEKIIARTSLNWRAPFRRTRNAHKESLK
jgi:predicted RND superfamily exporter protein